MPVTSRPWRLATMGRLLGGCDTPVISWACMFRYVLLATAWGSIAVIAYATLSRVAVVYQIYDTVAPVIANPSVAHYVHFSHVAAYAVAGALFALAYPNRPILVGCIVAGAALTLEYLQTLTPDRHGTLNDAAEKILGGVAGIALIYVVLAASRRFVWRKLRTPAL
jgi:VanZ family protein